MRQHEKSYQNKIRYSSDQEFLKKAFSVCEEPRSKELALSRIKDESFLKKIFLDSKPVLLKKSSLANIKDQKFLTGVILDPRTSEYRHCAAKNMTDLTYIKRIMDHHYKDEKLFLILFETNKLDNFSIFQCLKEINNSLTWNMVIPKITSRSLLLELREHVSPSPNMTMSTTRKILSKLDERLEQVTPSLDFIIGEEWEA